MRNRLAYLNTRTCNRTGFTAANKRPKPATGASTGSFTSGGECGVHPILVQLRIASAWTHPLRTTKPCRGAQGYPTPQLDYVLHPVSPARETSTKKLSKRAVPCRDVPKISGSPAFFSDGAPRPSKLRLGGTLRCGRARYIQHQRRNPWRPPPKCSMGVLPQKRQQKA